MVKSNLIHLEYLFTFLEVGLRLLGLEDCKG